MVEFEIEEQQPSTLKEMAENQVMVALQQYNNKDISTSSAELDNEYADTLPCPRRFYA